MYESVIAGGATLAQGYGCTGIWLESPCVGCERWHSGYDLDAPCGAAALAGCSGVVLQVGHGDPGYGPNAVFLLRDDGVVEFHGHLQAAAVRPGQRVVARQVLGQVGTLGNSTGCHDHYSIRPRDAYWVECSALDPAPYIAGCTASGAPSGGPPASTRPAPLSALAVLLLLDPSYGRLTHSPAAPGLGVTWEP